MKYLFLRGKVDRRTQRVTSLVDHHDMWTQLFHAICIRGGNPGTVLYWGGERYQPYAGSFQEVWIPSLKEYNGIPDVIFARGGFPEYNSLIERFPEALTVYYGAGVRTYPKKPHSIVLVDSVDDWKRGRAKCPKSRVVRWRKPAAHQFVPHDVPKIFDLCYIANGQQAQIKRIEWVYKTVPKKYRVLHLGYPSKFHPPPNVTCRRVPRETMPFEICRCRAGIAPYKPYDSAPRALAEMVACGLPVVGRRGLRHSEKIREGDKTTFWDLVQEALDIGKPSDPETVVVAARKLEEVIRDSFVQRKV